MCVCVCVCGVCVCVIYTHTYMSERVADEMASPPFAFMSE
jgi:hypothetical protein